MPRRGKETNAPIYALLPRQGYYKVPNSLALMTCAGHAAPLLENVLDTESPSCAEVRVYGRPLGGTRA